MLGKVTMGILQDQVLNWAGQGEGNYDSYGLCIDSQGNVWHTQLFTDFIFKFSPNGTYLGNYSHGKPKAQGCVAGLNGDIWVAHGRNGPTTVGHLANNGTFLGVVTVDDGPTGVAVDRVGKIWSSNYNGNTLSRIDPSLNGGIGGVDLPPINLGGGCDPYNYGDMTGKDSVSIAPPNTGSWTVIYNHSALFKAGERIEWTAVTPDDSSLTVQVKKDDKNMWTLVQNGQDLSLSGLGPSLQIRVSFFRASSSGASPVLKDLSISLITPTPTAEPTSSKPTTSNPNSGPVTLVPTPKPSNSPHSNFPPSSSAFVVTDVTVSNSDQYDYHYTTYAGDTSNSIIVSNNNNLADHSDKHEDHNYDGHHHHHHHHHHHGKHKDERRPQRNKRKKDKKVKQKKEGGDKKMKKKKKGGVFK
jgi:hypothetical protein